MPSQQSSSSSSKQPSSHQSSSKQTASSSNQTSGGEKSNNAIIKEGGWNDKHDFMRSYGLKPYEVDDYEEASRIQEGFAEQDRYNEQQKR